MGSISTAMAPRRRARTVLVTSLRLDSGEAQAIALAKKLGADAVLIDERKGRRVAVEHGLNAVGTVAVLEFAAERGMLDLRMTLEALRTTMFFISVAYIESALQRDAARRRAEHNQPDVSELPRA
jgi:predicted nucleic acid-binding protein